MTQSEKDWEKQLGLSHGTLRHRLRRGWSLDRAMTEKPMPFRQAGIVSARSRGYRGATYDNPYDKFWLFCKRSTEDECWEWSGSRLKNGYGVLNYRSGKQRKIYAHRLSWEIHNGSIHNGFFILHRCDNPPCVNPGHLFLGTQGDNMRDMFAKGRRTHLENMPRGSANHLAILSEADVIEIRKLQKHGESLKDIAAKFPVVTKGAIWRILKRLCWRHLP